MIVAIIDLGTNTFNLFIASSSNNRTYKKLFRTKISVKLGEGGINKNLIAPAAFDRGINALKAYKTFIEKYGAEKVMAFATSAIRGAANGKAFIKKAQEETGINISIISGEKEAEYIYYGVREALDVGGNPALIIDIGGGSTEFIIADKNQIFWKQSFLLGAARLLEKFKPSDPITPKEIQDIEHYLHQELQPLFDAVDQFPIQELIGSSGSFDSLAAIIVNKFYSSELLHNKTEYVFSLEDYDAIYRQLLKSTKEERLHTKGLIEMRVDMVVISSILIDLIIKKLQIKKMRLSTYSLKEGVLWEYLNSNQLKK